METSYNKMEIKFNGLYNVPQLANYNENDVLVLFGEVFEKGYATGLVQAAQRKNMRIIALTMGRRDEGNILRQLNIEEEEALQTLSGGEVVNIPLWAGFDNDAYNDLPTLSQICSDINAKNWKETKLDWDAIAKLKQAGRDSFNERVKKVMAILKEKIPTDANVVFAHLMAGGLPRVRVNLAVASNVVRGSGKRYTSSSEFWETDLGKLSYEGFYEVSAETFNVLLNESEEIRKRNTANSKQVSYIAFGYHGTEILINNKPQWQSYAPYLPGYAKIGLEKIAIQAQEKGIQASVFNCPEIETNSSAIFSGVELSLYPFIYSLQKIVDDTASHDIAKHVKLWNTEKASLIQDMLALSEEYHCSEVMQDRYAHFDSFPIDNTLDHMNTMIHFSESLAKKTREIDAELRSYLSALVVEATGEIMLNQSDNLGEPVYWLGHGIIAHMLSEMKKIAKS